MYLFISRRWEKDVGFVLVDILKIFVPGVNLSGTQSKNIFERLI